MKQTLFIFALLLGMTVALAIGNSPELDANRVLEAFKEQAPKLTAYKEESTQPLQPILTRALHPSSNKTILTKHECMSQNRIFLCIFRVTHRSISPITGGPVGEEFYFTYTITSKRGQIVVDDPVTVWFSEVMEESSFKEM